MGGASPNTSTNKRKFGPQGTHDISQKTRTDFTSLTESYRKAGQSSMNRFSSTTVQKKAMMDASVGSSAGTKGMYFMKAQDCL